MEQSGKVVCRCGDKNPVAFPQNKFSVRRNGFSVAQHHAHKHLAPDNGIQAVQRKIAQPTAGFHTQLNNFHPALCKGVPFQKTGVLQQPADLRCGLPLRIDSHGERKNVPHLINLVAVFRVADTCDGVQLRV